MEEDTAVELTQLRYFKAAAEENPELDPPDFDMKHEALLPVLRRESSAASLIRCASPPESSVEGWPSRT